MLSCRALPRSAPLKIWLFICAAAIAIQLGRSPLLDADEGRNAEVAREMAATNDYVVPRLNTLPYLDKPIVYFAAAAAFMEVLGPTELAARLPAYLFTLATAALILWWTRKRVGEEEARVAAIAYMAMPLTIAFARIVIFDSALSFFIVLAAIAFYEAVETGDTKWTMLAWAAIGLGVLTKGPVAIALPLLIAIPYAIWRKAFRMLWSIAGTIAFAVIVAPWVWAMSLEVPDFLEYVLVTETAARMATDELKRTGPPWYFLPYLIGGALPWSIVALSGWRQWKRRDPFVVFVLLWVLVPLIFFSISQSKRPQYILPLMPGIAILVAWGWRAVRFRIAAITTAAFGAVLLAAVSLPQLTQRMRPEIAAAAKPVAAGLGIALAAAGIVALVSRRREVAFIALTLPVIAMPVIIAPLMDALGERRSTRSLVARIAPHVAGSPAIIGVEAFSGSLAFYLRRPMILATDDASELTSNYILRRYEQFSGRESSPVKPMSWLAGNLEECCQKRIYVARVKDPEHQQLLTGRGARMIGRGAHHIIYAYDGAGR